MADKDLKCNNKTSLIYKVINFLSLVLMVFFQLILWYDKAIFTPLFFVIIPIAIHLFVKPLSQDDFRGKTKFFRFLLSFFIFALIYNYLILHSFYIVYSITLIQILLLGMLISLNNPAIIWQYFNIRLNILKFNNLPKKAIYLGFYLLGGLGVTLLGVIFFSISMQEAKSILAMLLNVMSVILVLWGSILFFAGISIVNSMLIKRDYIIYQISDKNIDNAQDFRTFENLQNTIFKYIVYIAIFYLILLPLVAVLEQIKVAYYAFPITAICVWFLHLITKIKLSYEETIYLRGKTEKVFMLLIFFAVLSFILTRDKYITEYTPEIWKQNLIFFEFNSFFYSVYSIFAIAIVAFLLPLNNVRNTIKFFKIENEKSGHSFIGFLAVLLVLILVYWLLLFSNTPEKFSSTIFYYIITLLFTLLLAAISARFLNYLVYLLISKKIRRIIHE